MAEKSEKPKYRRFKVDRILLPDPDAKLDEALVSEIAESLLVQGQLQPIAVRRCSDLEKSSSKKFELLAGAHRLQAVKVSGGKLVDCVVIDANDTEVRLIQIAENLWRKHLTVLQRAELVSEWLTLASGKVNLSGQVVQKGKLGRPSSGIALAARKLPVIGRSVGARRKIIERAVKIAHLSPEAKNAVRNARLDNNQRALVKIAKAGTWKAQLKKVAELTAKAHKPTKVGLTQTASGTAAAKSSGTSSPSLRPTSNTETSGGRSNQTSGGAESPAETTFAELEAFWDRKARKMWAYSSASTRQRFIEKLNRSVCKALPDVTKFVRDAVRGRELVSKKELAALGVAKGLSRTRVLKTAKSLYPSKRKGQKWDAEWFFRNTDPNWKDHMRVVSDTELKEALQAGPDPRSTRPREWSGRGHDYYDDLDDAGGRNIGSNHTDLDDLGR